MGMSSSANIIFGFCLGAAEEIEGPWHDGRIDDWYLKIRGFAPEFEIYDARGNYLPGIEDNRQKIDEWYRLRREWIEANPEFFDLYYAGHCDYSSYYFGLKKPSYSGSSYDDTEIDPSTLVVSEEDREALIAFAKEHFSALEGNWDQPKWYLITHWG